MLHQKSIHQSKLLQALLKKRMTKTPTDQPIEEYYPDIAEPHVVPEIAPAPEIAPVAVLEPIPEQESLSATVYSETQKNVPIMELAEINQKTPIFPFPTDFTMAQKKYTATEDSKTAKMFQEYQQFKLEQDLWNQLNGR